MSGEHERRSIQPRTGVMIRETSLIGGRGSNLQAALLCQTVGLGMRAQISGVSHRTVLET